MVRVVWCELRLWCSGGLGRVGEGGLGTVVVVMVVRVW